MNAPQAIAFETIGDLVDFLGRGHSLVVSFNKEIEEKEEYAEPGMRATVLRAGLPQGDGVVQIFFDFEPHEAFNAPLEKHTYYDKSGVPCLTARQAGFYKAQDSMYFELTDKFNQFMSPIPDEAMALRLALMARHSAQARAVPYAQWLEDQVLALQDALASRIAQKLGDAVVPVAAECAECAEGADNAADEESVEPSHAIQCSERRGRERG